MPTIDPKPKRKNDDTTQNDPRRITIIAGIATLSVILLAVGFIVQQPRFTPLSDVPDFDLVYTEAGARYRLDFQTGERTPLTDPDLVGVGTPQTRNISPDGRWFVEFKWLADEEKSVLSLVDLVGQQPPRVLGKFSLASSAYNTQSWSPDQQWVAFSAYPYDSVETPKKRPWSEIWLIHIPTSRLQRLTINTYTDKTPMFSPDGAQIAYMSDQDGSSRLYIMELATGKSRLLIHDQAVAQAVWSPNGQWIAYQVKKRIEINPMESKNLYNLYAIRADGLRMQEILIGEKSGALIGWKQ